MRDALRDLGIDLVVAGIVVCLFRGAPFYEQFVAVQLALLVVRRGSK